MRNESVIGKTGRLVPVAVVSLLRMIDIIVKVISTFKAIPEHRTGGTGVSAAPQDGIVTAQQVKIIDDLFRNKAHAVYGVGAVGQRSN